MKLFVHPQTDSQINALIKHPKRTVLLFGPEGVGKFTVAREIARRLTCAGCENGSCSACVLAAVGSSPNIILVEPDAKNTIGVQAVHQLHHTLNYRPYGDNQRRIAIIHNADSLSLPAQNALLKLLEEPPVDTLLILTAIDRTALLDTVVSRCRLLYVPPLSVKAIEGFLLEQYGIDQQAARHAATLSHGAVGKAIRLVRDVDQLQHAQQIQQTAQGLVEGQLFDRLQVAATLATAPQQIPECLSALADLAHFQARHADRLLPEPLEAIQKLQQRLKAHIAPRVALEAYVLEAGVST